jgi:signal peptidase II
VHHVQGGRRSPLEVRRPFVWLVVTAAITLAVDQISKAVVRTSIGTNETITVITGVLDLAHVQNTGAAFGMLPGQRELFIAVPLLMLLAVAVYWHRERPRAWLVVVPLGLVVGGALGNLFDRAFRGHVTDFLSFSFFAPVYNIADTAIVVGVGGLILWVFFGTPSARQSVDAPGADEVEPAHEGPAPGSGETTAESSQ